MSARSHSTRIEYAAGEAWCIAAGRVVLVCERDLTGERAAAVHAYAAAVESLDGLRALVDAEPTALIALIDLDGSRALLRRHGVPAAADESPLPDRYGEDWALDEVPAEQTVAAGGLGALGGDTLPFEGGVARVAAVRVAPRRADASAGDAGSAPVTEATADAPSTGAFGQTLPPVVAAEARAEAPEQPESTTTDPAGTADPVAPAQTDTGNPLGGLIDSVPGFIKPAFDVHGTDPEAQPTTEQPTEQPPGQAAGQPADASPAAQSAPAAQAEPAPSAAVNASAPSVSAPAPAPAAEEPAPATPAAAPGGDLGDHDGMTVTVDRARELMAEQGQREPTTPPATGPLVLSTLCPDGHVNAPGTQQCFTCGARIDESSAAQRRRPEVAFAVLTSGERVPLGRGVVIGRRPRSRRVEDGRVPRLVTVDSPSEDISRSHVELRVEDWNLVAIDLSSTNGTLLLREGASPQRLRPEASTILQLGDRLDLGDAQVVTIEAAP